MPQSTPPSWAAEPCLMGIDEAGRGPVLGPMVYGAAFAPLRCKAALAERAFADSKTLTEEKRENLYAEIEADAELGFEVDSTSASRISTEMLRSEKISLNIIANDSTVKLIDRVLGQGINLKEVYCDTVGDAKRWQEKLLSKFPAISFTVCPKADAIYPIVSAASIVAKVSRDRELRAARPAGESSPGSGYPGDPATLSWLSSCIDPVFGFPDLVRFSWQTTKKLLDTHAEKVTWGCDEEVDASQQRLKCGLKRAAQAPSSAEGRHAYFRGRKLQRLEIF